MALPTGEVGDYRYNPGRHSRTEHGMTGWKASLKASGSTPEEVIANNKAIEQWLMANHKAEFKPYSDDSGLFWRAETLGGSAKEMEEFSARASKELGNVLDTSFKYADDPKTKVLTKEFAPGIRGRFDTQQTGLGGKASGEVIDAFKKAQKGPGKLPDGVSVPWNLTTKNILSGGGKQDQMISSTWSTRIEAIKDKIAKTTDPTELARLNEGLQNEEKALSDLLGKSFPGIYMRSGGVVYASKGTLVPQSSPPGKDIVDVSNIENNERVFSSYSDKFGSSSSPISDSAIVSDKVGVPQPKISSNSTRINGTVKNISAKMAQGKEVQDIKGIELSENQVAKINNLYTEAKDQTVPALDKILDKQSISKASENISSTVNNISNVIKGINQQTELVGSIGTSGTKELLAQMSPKAISGSVNDGPQYKAGGGIVYASNGTLVAARSVGTDTVPAMLTPGEFVVNRQASQQHMPILQAINSGAYNQGGVVKYLAEGGIVAPQYHMFGGLAKMAGGAMEAFAGMDMSAIKELAGSLADLKDTFGSLENVKSLGDSLQVAVNTMGTNISSFGEQISSIPSQVLHNVSASVTQHVTGLGDAGRDILAQATTNASLIARSESSTIERNRFKSEEGQGSHPDSILGHVGGGGEVTG